MMIKILIFLSLLMRFKEQIISVISFNIGGHFVKRKGFDRQFVIELGNRVTQIYEQRHSDVVFINLQETFELTQGGLDDFENLHKEHFLVY